MDLEGSAPSTSRVQTERSPRMSYRPVMISHPRLATPVRGGGARRFHSVGLAWVAFAAAGQSRRQLRIPEMRATDDGFRPTNS